MTRTGLALWGGGVRGAVTIEILDRLIPIEYDMVAGTSTGGILAAGLGAGVTVPELRDLYADMSKEIFSRPWWRRGLFTTKYSSGPRERILRKVFGERSLMSSDRPTMLIAYDLLNRSPRIFKSWKDEVSCIEACMATSAAPTYFPDYKGFIDGGIFANNPSMCLFAEMMKKWPDDEIRIVSVGTGYTVPDQGNGGVAGWAKDIIPIVLSADEVSTGHQCRTILDENYLEINPPLNYVPSAMDLTDPDHLIELRMIGRYCSIPNVLARA